MVTGARVIYRPFKKKEIAPVSPVVEKQTETDINQFIGVWGGKVFSELGLIVCHSMPPVPFEKFGSLLTVVRLEVLCTGIVSRADIPAAFALLWHCRCIQFLMECSTTTLHAHTVTKFNICGAYKCTSSIF